MSAVMETARSTVELIPTAFALGAEVRCGDMRTVIQEVKQELRKS